MKKLLIFIITLLLIGSVTAVNTYWLGNQVGRQYNVTDVNSITASYFYGNGAGITGIPASSVDLSNYYTKSQINTQQSIQDATELSDNTTTNSRIDSVNSSLANYVTLGTSQTITGDKAFTGTIIIYNSTQTDYNTSLSLKDGLGVVQDKIDATGYTYFNGGNVGIGTTAPVTKLDVNGDIGIGNLRIRGANKNIIYETDSTLTYQMWDSSASATRNTMKMNYAGTYFTYGNVGIGTTSPGATLQIGATTAADHAVTKLFIAGETGLGTSKGVMYLRRDDAPSNSNTIGYLAAFGRINSNTAAWYMGADTNNNAVLVANNADLRIGRDLSGTFTEYMRILNSNGNVGIGTTSPSAKLDVVGNVSVSVGGSANHAMCWKADGKTLGYCSDIVSVTGTCTCN